RSHAEQNAAANASPAPVASTAATAGAEIVRPKTRHPAAPSFSTGTCARFSRGTPRVAASLSVAKRTSGARRARPSDIRAGPAAHGDRARRSGSPYRAHVDAFRLEVGNETAARLVVADASDQAGRVSQRGRPRAEVRRLAAAPDRDRGGGVVVRLERAVGHDPDIEHEVADGDDQDLTRIAAQGTSIAVAGIHANVVRGGHLAREMICVPVWVTGRVLWGVSHAPPRAWLFF